ncbi:rhodanese-like domain-containing protein [Sporosalibacterium faouarense]|uniref:rhodanese-like domain-containing protein n=1 Tax=Sporosalibacterium faouarense TaxID=516123 RepID=UPI00192C0D08|nr:rhodanese-like domain-containing protein [Sporosalibacterium faouarense]
MIFRRKKLGSNFRYETIDSRGLQKRKKESDISIIDIRETDEYVNGHIPGAISHPLSNLKNSIEELDKKEEYYLVCRTGRRVQMSTKIFAESGFEHIIKVIPGMSEWHGDIESGNS